MLQNILILLLGLNLMAVWSPQPGPQAMAAVCPVDFPLFGGSRGGGKSDCLLGRHLRGAEKYKRFWNGLIVRRKYKDFLEIRRRIDEFIMMGLKAERIGGDQQTNYLRFKNGAQVAMPAISRLEMVNDFVGHQYCVAEGTPILMGDGAYLNIESVSVGDLVMTLEGPRKVTRKVAPYKTKCVKATLPWGEQIHPITHPILTAFGWQSYASLLDIYSTEFGYSLQGFSQHLSFCVPVRLLKHDLCQDVPRSYLTTEYCGPCISSIPLHGKAAHLLSLRLNLMQPCEPFQPLRHRELASSFAAHMKYAPLDWRTTLSFQSGYNPFHCLYDEQLLSHLEIFQGDTPSQDDVGKPFHAYYKLDAQGNIPKSTHHDVSLYVHPYTVLERQATEETLFYPCEISPYKNCVVHDLTVDEVNHYISYDTHIINRNCEISIDEVTTFPFFSRMVDKLKGSNRSPHGVPCHLFGTGNPGGPGHSDVKEYFKLGSVSPIKPGQVWMGEGPESRVFIPSFLDDNRILCEADPKYVNRLKAIRDPALRRAWILGDWDVFIGQAFPFNYARHVIKPVPIPQYAPIYMTFDWGYAKPFSFGWWWLDADNRLYRFAEWYGWNKTPDEGLRLTDSVMAEGIKEREQKMGISTRNIIRLSDPTCFNKKPDYRGGGQGPSTAEVFGQHGIYLVPGDPSRELKIRQFRERMAIPTSDLEMPMMVVYDTCTHFVRTIPALCMDEMRPEDIDTETEDHVYDEACLIAMSRPLSLKTPITPQSSYDLRIERLIRGDRDNFEDFATVQHEISKRHLGADAIKYNAENYEDGDTVPTVS